MDPVIIIILAILVSCVVNLIATPIIIRVADRYQWYDRLNHRKIHTGKISRIGGIGIFVSFVLGSLIAAAVATQIAQLSILLLVPILGAVMVFGIGIVDDFYELRARLKLIVQFTAAVLPVVFGFVFTSVYIPFLGTLYLPGIIAYPLTVLWILGVVNAVNLIDGMDGLAGLSSAIAAAGFGFSLFLSGQVVPAAVCFALVGALLGFLAFNRPKARIFMGDGGAYFLGFVLAIVPLLPQAESGSTSYGPNLVYALTLLLIPIADTIAAIVRRARKRMPFSHADRHHMHHKMLAMGMSVPRILVIVFSIEVILATAVVCDSILHNVFTAMGLMVSWLVVLVFFIYLDRAQYRVPRVIAPRDGQTIRK